MAHQPPGHKQLEKARLRRTEAAVQAQVRFQSFTSGMMRSLNLSFKERMTVATAYLHSRVLQNISRPVTKTVVKRSVKDKETGKRRTRSRTIVTNRSKAGEFPKADTTQLMKTLIQDVQQIGNETYGWIGTPLDYGAILETNERLDRSFLVRTLREEQPALANILTQTIT